MQVGSRPRCDSLEFAALTISLLSCSACTPARGPETEPIPTAIEETVAPALGDSATVDAPLPLAGGWRAAESEDERELRLGAIDAATASLGRFQKGLVRDRLADRTAPASRLTIDFAGSAVTVAAEQRVLELTLGGAPIEISTGEEQFMVSATLSNDELTVVALDDAGGRTTTYRAIGDGLSIGVAITSDRFAAPIEYVTTYVRGD